MLDGYISEESANEVSVSSDEEMPRLDFDDYDSDWFVLRTKLWRVLGYLKDELIHDKIQNMWRTNLEIRTVGWPVMPLEVFCELDLHSSSTKV